MIPVTLEYEPLRELIGRYVGGPMGRHLLEQMTPSEDRAAVEAALAETAEAMDYLRTASAPKVDARGPAVRLGFGSLPDVAFPAGKLRIEGATLDAKEIFDLTAVLDRAAETRTVLQDAGQRFPLLAERTAAIGDFRELLRHISGKILADGSVADHASVALSRIRRDMEKQRGAIHDSLERFLRTHREDGVLQEEFVTIRNDRFVVPVVAGQKRRVDGVIHGASGSGQTLFVEPLETIDLNNELVRLTEEEAREVHRILREMTARLRAQAPDIVRAIQAIAELDLLFAKAEFGLSFDCCIPRISPESDRRLLLRQARHPLLTDVMRKQRKPVVPLTLELDRERHTLLISGPNTGGKTVAMKTVGLLALMAQSGLPTPAEEAELPLFDRVLADIGDNQSIQESLSTFSAHITQVRHMLEDVTGDSLVLLDELGRATDPEEGGALGVAILERFRAAGATTLASTHLLALKVYGATTSGVVNGSMGFDEQTLEPTYVLRLGAPGKSAGLDIASRLGLPPHLIERARAAMTTSARDVAKFLAELQDRLQSVEQERRELAEERERLAARERELEREYAKREAAKMRELDQRSAEAIAQFEAQAQNTLQDIRQNSEQRKAAEQAERKVAKAKREFRQQWSATLQPISAAAPQAPPKIVEGARVRLRDVREIARVRRIAGERVEVEAGFLKMQVSPDDIVEVLPEGQGKSTLPKNVTFTPSEGPRWDVTYREINVIGKRAEEAVDEVDRFLDSAALASIDRVRIVHGHGMGVLKRALSAFLAKSPYVEKHYPASPSEGGTGATIVELKNS